ncbi:hypothetical protein RP20_CCG027206 [Aedes albopictus]|nr:hypothetical protein RP20_CCG027206 [Aedes albopictus]
MRGNYARNDRHVILVQSKVGDSSSFEREFYHQRQINLDHEGSYLAVFRPVIILGQVFAIFPVIGYGVALAERVRFKWCSLRMLYTMMFQLGGAIMSGFSLATFWTTGVEFSKILSWMFFTINLSITIGFTVLARRWSAMMTEWENTEQSLPFRPQLTASNRRVRRKVITIMVTLMVSALFEHALAKPSGLYRAYKCGIQDLLEAHLMQAFPEMFSFIPYDIYVGFVAQVVTSVLTFYWNYVDLFLIALSIGLRQNVRHVNDIILKSKAQYHSDTFWHDYRKHHQRVCNLVHIVGQKVAYLVVISFANNMFFICIQLIGVLKPYPGIIVAIYVWYSLAHLMTRMVMVAVYAAAIHDESRRILPTFRTLPTQFYSKEISGTIVTYELVLLQVNDAEEKNGDQNPCT